MDPNCRFFTISDDDYARWRLSLCALSQGSNVIDQRHEPSEIWRGVISDSRGKVQCWVQDVDDWHESIKHEWNDADYAVVFVPVKPHLLMDVFSVTWKSVYQLLDDLCRSIEEFGGTPFGRVSEEFP